MSLEAMPKETSLKIALTHYPPIGLDLQDSDASKLFEAFGISHCVFGHLHSVRDGAAPFGRKNGVDYHLVSCDYLNFHLKKIV